MNFLEDLENSTKNLLEIAQVELQEHRVQSQRELDIARVTEEIQGRITPLLAQIEQTLTEFDQEAVSSSLTRKKLEEQASQLRQTLENAPLLAAQKVDEEFLRHEELVLNRLQAKELEQWRHQLKQDLLELIEEQDDFYSATDVSIAVKGYATDLREIGALEEVVEALMTQINSYDRNKEAREEPVARLRGTYEQTLSFIADIAQKNRTNCERPSIVLPKTRHRRSDQRPSPYANLSGKVVIFGGHDRLETVVRNRLRSSSVELTWCTAQTGMALAEQAESQISSADLVLIVTAYTSHTLTERVMQVARRKGKTPTMINTTGMLRLLEAIEYGLKAQTLTRKLSKSKTA